MQREIFTTRDGSHSISIPEMNVMYHSIHGALQESIHVFIRAGLHHIQEKFPDQALNILEVGFGTGLNALLTLHECLRSPVAIGYTSLEPYPLEKEKTSLLNYPALLESPELEKYFDQLHNSEWEKEVRLLSNFTLCKKKILLQDFSSSPQFHVVYFDAFAPTAQAELWTTEMFEKLYRAIIPGGILVTYCSKSVVRRAMEAAGFKVTKPQGPWGKREMLRAIK
ncbi:tRNA (5-methylaminomethyl-2-thiouridine)(34)-methyltransferase MnmD [Terrimonas sp. NA20]|uniref:tRNA (5-methylaminomethyl-2-thiouridine)(34)-methyltransferase MnmD n=1 Tax=Terrimonas ginsenosidimutans TaxID=2908004 RepID=A0ABS9KUU2_9BACT|nr:tRNA (5-methylaminomethyl-2-thiouridine)(34)-methyltransferase MnmD [Terrimonas ginsenosidimutans]MCG2616098.1 tRNA (5-methylaminomethyl-2-thiouridine)(34)-methyltransferase MnmD [Terrimonas ginsenosidimutans]